jgi:hypothetical protein
MLRKKYFKNMIDEEADEKEKQSKRQSRVQQSHQSSTYFSVPGTPPRASHSNTMFISTASSGSKDILNQSASSIGIPPFNESMQISPGTHNRLDNLSISASPNDTSKKNSKRK